MSISEMSRFSLGGDVALVTGATRGIGRACAIALGSTGAAVAPGCRDLEAGTAFAKELKEGGVKAIAFHMNMLSLESIEQAISAVGSGLGPLSVLVNNAGLSHPAPAMNVTEVRSLRPSRRPGGWQYGRGARSSTLPPTTYRTSHMPMAGVIGTDGLFRLLLSWDRPGKPVKATLSFA